MTGMEHIIEQAARTIRLTREFQAGAAFGVPVDAYEDYALGVARALAEAGLLAHAPLREEWVAGGEALTPHAQFDTINTKHPQAKALEHFRSLVATIGEHTVPEARVCHDLVNLSQVVGLLDRQIAAIYANQPGFLVDTMIRPEGDGRAVR